MMSQENSNPEDRQQQPTPAPEGIPDPVAIAREVESLQLKHAALDRQKAELKDQIEKFLRVLDGNIPSGLDIGSIGTTRRSRPVVANPRPLEDKISISAGRAIARGKKLNKTADECLAMAIQAAENIQQSELEKMVRAEIQVFGKNPSLKDVESIISKEKLDPYSSPLAQIRQAIQSYYTLGAKPTKSKYRAALPAHLLKSIEEKIKVRFNL